MLRVVVVLLALAVGASPALAGAKAKRSRAAHRYKRGSPRIQRPEDAAETPAVRYGLLSPAACQDELEARGISFVPEVAPGVEAAVRLTGPLRGVTFRSGVARDDRSTTPFEITDCRLVLALDDFAGLLRQHEIVEVVHYSIYRRPRREGVRHSQHAGALAIDAARFVRADGSKLSVLDDFHGRIGAKTCGAGARPRRATAAAKELRLILCDAVAQHFFHVFLTPNFNRPHRNHFHLELMPGAEWFLIH